MKPAPLGTGLSLFGLVGWFTSGAKIAEMLLAYGPDTYNAVIAATLSIIYNVSLALGITCLGFYFYPKLKARINKRFAVPVFHAVLYLWDDSVMSETLKAEDTIKDAVNMIKYSANNGNLVVMGREKATNSYKRIPRELFSENYAIGLTTGGTRGTTKLCKSGTAEAIFVGLLINEEDMLKLWPPHDLHFTSPSSWVDKPVGNQRI